MKPHFHHGQRVDGLSPYGDVIRTGDYKDCQLRADSNGPGEEYEAIVRWDGDDVDSRVPSGRLIPSMARHADFHTTVAAVWADWTRGRLGEEAAMEAIQGALTEFREQGVSA